MKFSCSLLLIFLSSCNIFFPQNKASLVSQNESFDEHILAEIGSEQIRVKDFKQAFPISNLPIETKEALLDELISTKIIQQLASSAQITISTEEVDHEIEQSLRDEVSFDKIKQSHSNNWDHFRKGIQFLLTIRALQKQLPEVSERQIDYEISIIRNRDKNICMLNSQTRMSHILTRTEPEALEALAQIKAKPGNFEKIAKEYSVSPEAQKGGDVGFFQRGELNADFDRYFDNKIGFVSPVVKSPLGFHLFKVTGKKAASTKPDEDCLEKLSHQIKEDIKQKNWLDKLDDEKKRRAITKNTVLLKRI